MSRSAVAMTLAALVSVGLLGGAGTASASSDADVQPMTRIDPPGGTSRGAVLVIHGGAWMSSGKGAVDKVRPAAMRMAGRGYTAYLVDYRSGAKGFADVALAYRAVRASTPRGLPVCAWGESAGGHYALMLDVRFNPDCVMAVAAPTDLRALAARPTPLRDWVQDVANKTFGPEPGGLDAWSPLRHTRKLAASTALLYARADAAVDVDQGRSLTARLRQARTVFAQTGPVAYVHGVDTTGISRGAWTQFLGAERSVLRDGALRAARR